MMAHDIRVRASFADATPTRMHSGNHIGHGDLHVLECTPCGMLFCYGPLLHSRRTGDPRIPVHVHSRERRPACRVYPACRSIVPAYRFRAGCGFRETAVEERLRRSGYRAASEPAYGLSPAGPYVLFPGDNGCLAAALVVAAPGCLEVG